MNPIETAFLVVLDVTWRASCLILFVYALRPLLRAHLPARVVFAAWIAVALRLLLPVGLPTAWSPFNITSLWSKPEAPLALRPAIYDALPAPTGLVPIAPATPPSVWSRLAELSPLEWLAVGWASGVIGLATARSVAWLRFTRRLQRDRRARPGLSAPTEAGEIEIIVTEAVRAPALHGILRPRLLFPPGFTEGLTPDEFRLTVAHELTHARRQDLLVQALLHAAAILHWFNPLAWLAVRSARHDCELACDEAVLRRLPATEHAGYGATLVKIVTLAHGGLTPPRFGLGVVETKQHLKRRLEMIIAHPSFTPARTLFGTVLLGSLTLISLTRELPAQSPVGSPAPAATPRSGIQRLERAPATSAPAPSFESAVTTAAAPADVDDRLDTLYPTGTIATIGDRVITVADVRRELAPLLPSLRTTSGSSTYEQKLITLQDRVIQDLIARIMIIQEFRRIPANGQARHIAEEVIDNRIAEVTRDQFGNDREKFLAYLRARNMSIRDFRKQTEEEIIYSYVKGQERNVAAAEKAAAEKAADQRGKVHLRLIQLTRAAGETDAALHIRAKVVLDRFHAGEKFEALAGEFSQDKRRDRGGDWGWVGPSDVKATFADVIFSLKAGEIAQPIIVPEGGFLFYVEERK